MKRTILEHIQTLQERVFTNSIPFYKNIFFRMKKLNVYLFFAVSLFSASCEYSEGEGGDSALEGIVVENIYNDDYSILLKTKPAVDEDIYISYGNSTKQDDRTTTGRDGSFKFSYLFGGNYTIYFSTKDSNVKDGTNVLKEINVVLKDNKTTNLGELIKLKTANYNDGAATIRGRVLKINYKNGTKWPNLVVIDTTFAQEQEIYLTYNKHTFYDDRIRTQEGGTFEFNSLVAGDYKIVVYSENLKGSFQNDAVIETLKIPLDSEETYDLGDIFIHNL